MAADNLPPLSLDAAPLFSMRGISKAFGNFMALSGVDLDLNAGEIHCLLGENGAGKSTLCNLIFGVHAPSDGKMNYLGAPHDPGGPRDALDGGIAMVHQHFSLSPDLSALDNLLLGSTLKRLNRKSAQARIEALADSYGLKLDLTQRVGDLAVGERQRVEIVKALVRRPRLLILDEPTAVLLPEEISALLKTCRKVADEGCGVVMVTHKLAEIRSAADRVTVIRTGKVVAKSDAPAKEMDLLVSAMIGREDLPDAARQRLRKGGRRGPDVMQADGLSYRDAMGALRLDKASFTVTAGEVVGIAGVEGNGQTELGNILGGVLRPTEGRWFAGDYDLTHAPARNATSHGVGIVPEDRHGVAIAEGMSVTDNILNNRVAAYTRFGLLDRKRMKADAAELMSRFDVRASGPDIPIAGLSGGNQQKAVLARELTTPGLKFLLAAQPTRGLDIGAVNSVYDMIRQACDDGVGVLLISSELDEVLAASDRILVIYRGRIVAQRNANETSREEIGALMAGQAA
ncbi:ABC transporter ATP-binding protein [Pseudooceanicola atlanticus]|uniref:ABC transporter ATPase n=1 Tax=Pseudooceanicola atlanticus TaxID=1461694 RepID=A0A0A0E832_9RHOB|nr:ABC transporter ATP-binding protein [Pseudooceanicola atlanticus]KGM46564.1 ABC transporter ATPase [Pseudooceanicola atlanticus]